MPKKNNQIIKVEAQPVADNETGSPRFDGEAGVILKPGELTVKKGGNVIIGTLNVFLAPAKKRTDKFYRPAGNKFWQWHLLIDALLALIVIGLIIFNFYLFTRPEIQFALKNSQAIRQVERQKAVSPRLELELKKSQELLNPGETVDYIISYRNIGQTAAQDLIVTLNLDSELVSGSNKIVWTKATLPQLQKLPAGGSGEIKFSGRLKKDYRAASPEQTNFILSAEAEINYRGENNPGRELTAASGKIIQKINTDLTLNGFVRYYSAEGEQLGLGPLPPQVGQATKYWIFFNLENHYNDASDTLVTAQLPIDVAWTDKITITDDSSLSYNPDNRRLTWLVKKITAPAEFFPISGAAFELSFKPTPAMVGQTAKLLAEINLTATDDFTGNQINRGYDDLTTKLSVDAQNQNSGLIIK